MHRAEKHESVCRSSRDPVKFSGGGGGGGGIFFLVFFFFSAFVIHKEDGNRAPGVTFPTLRSVPV